MFLLAAQGESAFVSGSDATRWLLAAAGPVTAQRRAFAHLGILQCLSPTLQLALGVWVFHAPFAASTLAGYALIWIALAIFALDSLWQLRQPPPKAAAPQSRD